MKRKDDLIFLILFIFIHLKIIFNFEIKQIPNQSKLISLFSDSSNNQYFFTLTSIGKVSSSGTYQIISNTVNFNEYSKAYFANSVKTHFAVSCSSNNIIEIYDSNGNLIDYRTYSTFSLSEPNLICSIDYDFTTNKIYLGYSYYNSYDLYIYYTVIVFIMDDNGFISDYVSTQFSHETDFTSLDQIYNQAINCAVLRQPLCFVKRKEDISYSVFEDNDVLKYNSVIKIIVSHYKVEYINYDNTEMTLFEYRSDGIYAKTYFGYKEFLSARYIYSYYVINETVFHGSQILYNKTPVSLFISYRSGTYLVLDYTQLSSRNYYDTTTTDVYYIKNNIGYSQVMVSSSLDNNFFIMTRGESEPTTLEYFFYTYKQFECTPYTAKAYSKELITIQLSNLINSYDVTKNIASFKPSTTLARINNNEEVELLENNLDYGVISFNILFQTKGSDYNQTFLSENCFLSIQVCNDRCSKCETNTFSLTGTPTHCTSKMCLDTYYYDLDDTTNCLEKTFTCYDTCNTCSENGDSTNHKCETCKINYLLYNSNCISCDVSKTYWYYDERVSTTECQYTTDSKCPNDFNLLVVETNECVTSCPNDYPYLYKSICLSVCPENTISDTNKECQCSYNYYKDLDNNNEIMCLSSNSCTNNDYPYFISSEKECYKECPSGKYFINSDYECYYECPSHFYHIENEYECLVDCPSFYYIVDHRKLCVEVCSNSDEYPFTVPNTKLCADECPYEYQYHELNEFNCMNVCPNNEYIIETLKICLDDCEKSDNYKYHTQENKYCYSSCPESYNYKLNDSLTSFECYNHCPSNYIHVSNSLLCVKSCEYLWTLNSEGTECECKQDLNKISDYNLTCENSFNINEYIKEIISDSTSTTDLINNIIENIEIIKYVNTVIHSNVSIQVMNSTLSDEDLNSNTNLSYINLGECETILKKHYNLDESLPLIILLIDSSSKTKSLINSLNYKVFDQNGNELDLSLCSDTKITVYYAITNEDGTINIELVEHLTDKGVDLFNISSDFYHQRCFGFNYNGNDITTGDRQSDVYTSVSVCESGCKVQKELNTVVLLRMKIILKIILKK